MTSTNNTVVAAHPLGATPGIKAVHPQIEPKVHQCEMALNIGVFFDGTGNNQDWVDPGHGQTQLQRQKDSNVARLYRAYRDDDLEGYFRIYVPGVGTPFPKIGEEKPATLGQAFGAGGDGRINFGLLQVINSIYWSISPNQRLYAPDDTIKALCRNGKRHATTGRDGRPQLAALKSHEDEPALRRVNMEATGGLLLDLGAKAPQRLAFFKRACRDIQAKMAEVRKPKITEIFIDVYGFSRGSAEARTFTNWLLELFDGDTLCGVPAKIRFLGLFDTVASVGLPASFGLGQNGHKSWAQPEWLQIPKRVQNCVHFVAMHENRGSFPVELVQQNGDMPDNCQEFMFPGMHSDVGGGYAPREQGRGLHGKNEEKLSQVPLNAMYQASLKALVPLDKSLAADGANDPFDISDECREAFSAFMKPRQEARQVREWMFEYLAWRYQVRHTYLNLPWHQRASATDRDDLAGANQQLLKDVDALELGRNPVSTSPSEGDDPQAIRQRDARARVARLKDEAPDMFERLQTTPLADPVAASLFADYCHDSYAGFRPFDNVKIFGWDPVLGSWEPEGYFRWRRRYEGDNVQLVHNEPGALPGQQSGVMMASQPKLNTDASAAVVA
jgi:type VI secretion system (T6SS) phospholipase Tle1-like effector